jgi:hypothetical protein
MWYNAPSTARHVREMDAIHFIKEYGLLSPEEKNRKERSDKGSVRGPKGDATDGSKGKRKADAGNMNNLPSRKKSKIEDNKGKKPVANPTKKEKFLSSRHQEEVVRRAGSTSTLKPRSSPSRTAVVMTYNTVEETRRQTLLRSACASFLRLSCLDVAPNRIALQRQFPQSARCTSRTRI